MMRLATIGKLFVLVWTALAVSACYGCFDDVGLERDLFEERDMYPYEFDGEPAIDGPDYLLFLDLATGDHKVQVATVENVGRTVLYIDDFLVDGPFELSVPADFDGADRRLKPGETVDLSVGYTAIDDEPHEGELTILSDDPEQPQFHIGLYANVEVPCLELEPQSILNFGDVEQNESAQRRIYLTNCASNAELVVEISDLVDDEGFRFADEALANEELPQLTLAPGATRTVAVRFEPREMRAYQGEVVFETRGFFGEQSRVGLQGRGVSPPCPVAVISGTSEQESVIANPTAELEGLPLETVQFSAEQSAAADGGPIVEYQWTLVDRPQDTVVELGSPADATTNSLYLELSGTYEVELHVWDENGVRSCDPARLTVNAISGDAIHLQLVWNTDGTDLDLHFLHENGSWNSAPWDCHWLNQNPNWGNANNSDMNPRLDIDKVDGWGPENINLLIPENNVRYGVGVYYFSDHGYGPSHATVRIYIYGQLQLELVDRYIEHHEFWHVADIDWPSQAITVRDQVTDGFPP